MELTLTGGSLLSNVGARRRTGNVPSSSSKETVSTATEVDDEKESKQKNSCNHDAISLDAQSHSHSHQHSAHSHAHHHSHQRQMATIESIPVDQLLANPPMLFSAIVATVQAGRFQTFEYLCNLVLNYEKEHGVMNVWVEDEPSLGLNHGRSALARRSEDGFYLCHWASKRVDDCRFLEFLIAVPSVNVHLPSTDSVAMYPLHWAATVGSIALVHRILRHLNKALDHDHHNLIDCRDKTGCTPLLIAAQYGHADLVAFLIKRGADAYAVDDSKDTALHWAAYKGSVPVCSLLIHLIGIQGHLDLTDSFGQSPLHLASLRGNTEVVQYLLGEAERYMDLSMNMNTLTSFTSSDSDSQRDILIRLLHHEDRDGKTPLGLAIKKNKAACEVVLKEYLEKYEPMNNRSLLHWIRKNISMFFSVKNWKIFMGLTADASSVTSIRFVFWFVVMNLLAGTIMEFYVFFPWSPFYEPGRLHDCTTLSLCATISFMITWFSLILVNQTNPGIISPSCNKRNNIFCCLFDWENRKIFDEMERLAKNLQAEYNATLESFALEDGTHATGDPLLCHSCRIAKPLRSKHCRIMNRCVLLFDHYCPFIGNTVGLYNYRYFFLFLVSMTIAEASFICSWVLYLSRGERFDIGIFFFSMYLSFYILMTTGLMIYHTNLVVANLTTNEHQNVSKYKYLHGPNGKFYNAFNRNLWKNISTRLCPGRDSYTLSSRETFKNDEDTRRLMENMA